MSTKKSTRRGDSPLLIWADLETTCIDEDAPNAAILEMAVVFTTPHLVELHRENFLFKYRVPHAQWDPYVLKMHEKSELAGAVIDHDDCTVETCNLLSIEDIEGRIVHLLREFKRNHPEMGESKPRIAGFSIGNFDLQWVKRFMPGLYQRLSHRVLDVSSLIGPIRWYDLDPLSHEATAHRAMVDVDEAISAYKQCLKVLTGRDVWLEPEGRLCSSCGKSYKEHVDEHSPSTVTPITVCGGLKKYFKPGSAEQTTQHAESPKTISEIPTGMQDE